MYRVISLGRIYLDELTRKSFIRDIITEFSKIKKVVLIAGNIENMVETVYFNDIPTDEVYNYKKEIILTSLPAKGYLRSEVITASAHQAFSNPIWF